jgi:hypothetical protein
VSGVEIGVVVGGVVGFVVFEFLFAIGVGRFLRRATREDPLDAWLANLRRRPW